MADLEIRIAADVSNAVSGLSKLEKQVASFGSGVKTYTTQSVNDLKNLAAQFGKLPNSANQASKALFDLNRVVQDAPFGFVGIQNNIGPLIESFGQLRATTTTTGGAIRALAGSLLGPAGVGLAIGAVTSAITFAIQGFGSWTKGLGNVKEANNKLAESLATDLVELTTLVGLIQNTAVSTGERSAALKVLNEEYGKYLPGLDKEIITLANVKRSYEEIVDVMLRQAVVKGLQGEIAKEVEKSAKRIVELSIARERERLELEKNNNSNVKAISNEQKLARVLDQKNKAVTDGVLALNNQTQATRAAIGTTNVYDMQIEGVKKQLMDTLAPAMKLAKAFADITKPPPGDAKVDFDLIPGIRNLTEFEAKLAGPLEGLLPDLQKAIKKIRAKPKVYDIPAKVNIKPQKGEKLSSFLGFEGLTEAEKELAETGAMIAGVITPSIDAMIQAIGRGENAFQAFGQGVKAILVQVIQKLVATTILAGILAALFPGVGIGGAVGFKEIFGKLLGFRANGGPVSGNNPYIVGERGPELFVPAVSGSIVPNNSVGSFMSGRGGGGSSSSILRGQDILLAYARTQRSQLRVNG